MAANSLLIFASYLLEAVSRGNDKGYSISDACRALEIGPTALRRWIQQFEQEEQGITPVGCKALTTEQRQIKELQKRIQRLELEKDILKKATALLMTDELKLKR